MLRHGHRLIQSLQPRSSGISLRPLYSSRRAYSLTVENSHDVAVLGGGITGLACAYYLTKELPRAKITIYEASDRIGGWLSSKRVPVKDGNVLFEAGPRTLRFSGNGALSARLLQELDLAKDAIFAQNTSPAARNRFVYYPDHLVRMPHPSFGFANNLWSLLTEPVFEGAIRGSFGEFFKDPRDQKVEDESVGDFFARRLNKNVVDRIMSAIIHGIYAGDIYQLSAKSLFPTQWRDEVETGSIVAGLIHSRADGLEVTKRDAECFQEMKNFAWDPLLRATLRNTSVFTLKDGLGMLVDRLARRLLENGNVEFKTSTPVKSVTRAEGSSGVVIVDGTSADGRTFRHAISTLPPTQLNQVATSTFPSGTPHPATLIPQIPSVSVMTVNLYYRAPYQNPPGFGYLIPQATPFEKNPERALGVVFDDAYSPSTEDLDPKNWQVTDAEQLRQARERGQLVNINDFAWYNLPERPNTQDQVTNSGTKLTVMLGGHWWDGWPAFPDEKEGLELATSVLRRHLNIFDEPEAWQVNLQKDCIPQYTVGHEQRLMTAHNNLWREYKGRLRVAGNWISGVGVNDCLRSAWEVAQGLKKGKDATGLEHVGREEYVRLKPIRPGEPQED